MSMQGSATTRDRRPSKAVIVESRSHAGNRESAEDEAETTEDAAWLCLERKSVIVCGGCDADIVITKSTIIHVNSLDVHNWLRCECGHHFSVDELLDCGADMQSGVEALKQLGN